MTDGGKSLLPQLCAPTAPVKSFCRFISPIDSFSLEKKTNRVIFMIHSLSVSFFLWFFSFCFMLWDSVISCSVIYNHDIMLMNVLPSIRSCPSLAILYRSMITCLYDCVYLCVWVLCVCICDRGQSCVSFIKCCPPFLTPSPFLR